MASTSIVITRLSDLVDGQEAVCFAALVRKTRGTTKSNQPFIKCLFRDKEASCEAPLWHDHRFFPEAGSWVEGLAYRIQVRASFNIRFGMQIELLGIQPATEADAVDGFDFDELYESSKYTAASMTESIRQRIDRYITEPHLKLLVTRIIDENAELFCRMQAATAMHHSYTRGLLEHVWSMSRVGAVLVDHYGDYYDQLNPPLDKGVVMAAIILHDIGKLRELSYDPVEARYTKEGSLLGHIIMGRDLVRETARTIEGFPEETLLCLEHAILSHHGKREFGAPVVPMTIEALLVSFIDDLDAKMNAVARHRQNSKTEDAFTDRVFALENRRIYKGIPLEAGDDGEDPGF
ncbi:3'-5' exoribonuclease YhaM family protein [Planctomyces sp. SH-PL62]|uniref:3'-5' exoribonuclease YhaM family protein n=1 Tax=Planctomyces sp. SH-PL62 TaxID=1636152 RepID=UPI00078B2D0E|nr:HD domain-containing protein [Planctomyces sp. SH-PL62]AMV38693.1 3'-5' exoribonuclease YhaM [Planctomyces sp. SH-PL62]